MSFAAKTSAFVEWLIKENVEISDKVEIQDLRESGQGRALVAKEDIAADKDLFRLPETIFLNAQNNSLSKDYPEVSDKLLDLTQWEALILVVAYEWLAKKEGSKWSPYFDVLPVNDTENYKFDQLIFWTDKEVEFLRPSFVIERIGKDAAENLLSKVEGLIKSFGISELDSVDRDQLHKVAALIMSYSFDVQRKEEGQDEDEEEEEIEGDTVGTSSYFKSMLPLADTLNANTNRHNASLINHEKSLIMRSIKDIKKGEQIYNTYSEHPNAEILRRYGYVEPEGSLADFGEVSLESVKRYFETSTSLSSAMIEDIIKILISVQEEEDEEFLLEYYDCYISGEVTFEFIFLVQLLSILAQANEEVPFVDKPSDERVSLVKRAFKKCYQLLESGKLTESVKDHLRSIIKQRLLEYGEEAKIANEVKLPISRKAMAEVVTRSEYKALLNCADGDSLFKSSEREFSFVDDGKLLRNLLKNQASGNEVKRRKVSK